VERLLVVEDGTEYEEFARLFLGDAFEVCVAHSGAEALGLLPVDAVLMDLRFDRCPARDLVGNVAETADSLFGGDRARSLRYLQDQQGTLVLAELRLAGCDVPVVFIHDFPPRRLGNLQRLYGDVSAVVSFDASAIKHALRKR